jgi:hypothetical protein
MEAGTLVSTVYSSATVEIVSAAAWLLVEIVRSYLLHLLVFPLLFDMRCVFA